MRRTLQPRSPIGCFDRTTQQLQWAYRVEYSLTERGADLEPVVDALAALDDRHLEPSGREG